MAGYSQDELDDVQAKWALRFPPDLIELLREVRPLTEYRKSFDWLTSDAGHIRERLAWPFESYWRSIEINDFWWPEWGERPASHADQKETLRGIFGSAPKLIPLVGIRYVPDEPHESGNPVFSVMASDIIHDGANLIHWMERNLEPHSKRPWPPIKHIRFWGQAIRYMQDENSIVRRQIAAAALRRRQHGSAHARDDER